MLDVALKEWAVVVDLLVAGEAAFLLRKGGIHEEQGPGRFALEHERFALWPAWEHQDPDRIKPAYRSAATEGGVEPSEVTLHGWAESAGIWEVPSREAFDQLDDLHPWTREQIDMRFDYKPDRPLYLLLLRVSQLVTPRVLPNRPRYAGCRSWIDLEPEDAIDESGGPLAMEASKLAEVRERIERAFG